MRRDNRPDLSVSFCGLKFKNPIIAATGTFAYGIEFEDIVSLDQLGAIRRQGTLARTYGRQSAASPLRDLRRNAERHRPTKCRRARFRRRETSAPAEEEHRSVIANVFGYTRDGLRGDHPHPERRRGHRRLRTQRLLPQHRPRRHDLRPGRRCSPKSSPWPRPSPSVR